MMKVTKNLGVVNGFRHFEAAGDEVLTDGSAYRLAESLQLQEGYHPAGYGLYGVRWYRTPMGETRLTWKCSHSCD